MKRRNFITLLGGAVALPLVAHAQQPVMPVVGVLLSGSEDSEAFRMPSFRQGLSDAGYVDGRNVAIEYRWAHGQYDRLPALAADLVRHHPAVVAALGGTGLALAAKAATTAIPIVFAIGGDPVSYGLVASLNRPGGNVTGVSYLVAALEGKRLELLHELVPKATTVAMLVNPTFPGLENQLRDVREAVRALGQQFVVLNASTDHEIDTAFATLIREGADALHVTADLFLFSRRDKLVSLAARHRVPASYNAREYAEAGGLMSYGPSSANAYRQAGVYTGRILNGEKPTDLPVQQSTKVALVLNLKTAKALGITVPPKVLALADEVIE